MDKEGRQVSDSSHILIKFHGVHLLFLEKEQMHASAIAMSREIPNARRWILKLEKSYGVHLLFLEK